MKDNASYVRSSVVGAKDKAAENAAYYGSGAAASMAPMKDKASEKMSGGYTYAASSAASI